jgi:ERCC4-type nuclease
MRICVDYRERLKIPKLKEYVDKKCKIITGVDVVTSASGDVYTPDGMIGIERKGSDYVSSLYSEQIDKQLTELTNNFDYAFLFIEYEGIRDMITQNLGVNPSVLVGSLTSILARHKVSVIFVGDLYVSMVCKTIEKFYDGKTDVKNISYSPIRRGATPKEVRLDIISRIPKIGAVKGNKLLDKFHLSIISNKTNSEATIEELMEIRGIGRKMAEQIKDVLK